MERLDNSCVPSPREPRIEKRQHGLDARVHETSRFPQHLHPSDQILPVFNSAHPDIKVEFSPINTNEYNAAIQSQVEGGAGPDLITCRPFDVNNDWISRGFSWSG